MIPIASQFFVVTFSLKKYALNKIVVSGLAKNRRPETSGSVTFSPIRLEVKAPITTMLIRST